MKINTFDTYTILADERDDIAHFATFLERQIPASFEQHNVILDLLKYETLSLQDLLLFLKLSTYHRSTKHSFVIVNAAINPDEIPDELIVVPTLQEAQDIVEMEEIERDLGF